MEVFPHWTGLDIRARAFGCQCQSLQEKRLSRRNGGPIRGALLKPLNATVLGDHSSRGFMGWVLLKWAHKIAERDASLLESYTSDRCCIFSGLFDAQWDQETQRNWFLFAIVASKESTRHDLFRITFFCVLTKRSTSD